MNNIKAQSYSTTNSLILDNTDLPYLSAFDNDDYSLDIDVKVNPINKERIIEIFREFETSILLDLNIDDKRTLSDILL